MKILPDNQSKLNELLFENRNQAYGAYTLRRDQDKRTLMGFLFSLTFFGVAALGMKFFNDGPTISELLLLNGNNKIDTLRSVDIFNPPIIEQPKTDITLTTKVKTDPGTNYMAATKDADTIRTVADAKLILIGPKNDDTTGRTVIGTGTLLTKLPPQPDTTTWKYVAIMPEFDGDFLKYVKDNTVYPELAKANIIEGTVHVNFTIDQNGHVTNVKILNPTANKLLKKEALRVFAKVPKWKPGSDGTRNVRVSMTIPMKFQLN